MGDTRKRNQRHVFDDDLVEQKNAGKRKHSKLREIDDDIDLDDENPYSYLVDEKKIK